MKLDPNFTKILQLTLPNQAYYLSFWTGIELKKEVPKDKLHEIIAWCEQKNIHTNWTESHVFFKNSTDATLFKLAWDL